ncbi:MAG TPA: hypothetical protein VGO58_00355 [Chitinophagaceae bacterium]|nr:hypothetical protein [Chitinophagaceae bacterium]
MTRMTNITRILFSLSLLLLVSVTHAQALSHIQFSGGITLSSFGFTTDQQVIIKISENGKVLEWGTEWEPWRYGYQPGKLLPYMARVSYYGFESDSISNGKVKMIGTTTLSYYGSSDAKEKAGKLKSVGNVSLDYYSNYENAAFTGKLKSAAYTLFNYYSSYENEAFQGKLKSAGNSTITYYSTFDDKLVKGKVKSIDGVTYTWYTSYETRYGGGMKSGSVTIKINGVTYVIM